MCGLTGQSVGLTVKSLLFSVLFSGMQTARGALNEIFYDNVNSNTTLCLSICVGVCLRVFLYACHRVVVSFCGCMYVSANVFSCILVCACLSPSRCSAFVLHMSTPLLQYKIQPTS